MNISQQLTNEKSNKVFKIIIALTALLVLSIIITVIAIFLPTRIKIEAGEEPDFYSIYKTDDYELDSSFNPDCINHPGKYKFKITYNNRSRDIVLVVVDTTAPIVKLHKRIYVSSTDIVPTAEDFIESIKEADSYTGEFLTDMDFDFQVGQSYEIELQFSDPSGNKTEVMTSIVSYINDTLAPTIDAPDDITFEVGAPITYREIINITDNCIGQIKLEVNDTGVDYNNEGAYDIIITATDVSGNKSTKTCTVHIIPSGTKISLDELNERISAISNTIIKSGMSTEDKCRAIYDWVQKNITYDPESVGDGYIEVAYNALDTKRGDCYSYFSITKALLDYNRIQNEMIQRTPGKGEGTHFWNYVNIGTIDSPQWYHLDTTILRENYRVSGCLLTTKQVEAYDKWRSGDYFRDFDHNSVPTSATKIITPIEKIEPYM